MKKRLSKALAAAGIASRRSCDEIIAEGRVQVNGNTVLTPYTPVDILKDKITVDGESLKKEEKKVYFLLNKPPGYVCTTDKSPPRRKLVLDLLSHLPYRLFTIGRLDKETSGLLLITNDGEFANRVIHPSFNIQKEYLAKTNQEISADHLKTISVGTWVEGTYVKPIQVKKVRRGTLKITVGEGKKREVRHLLEHAGLTVYELCRIRLGPLTLGTLPEGSYRQLSEDEINSLTKN